MKTSIYAACFMLLSALPVKAEWLDSTVVTFHGSKNYYTEVIIFSWSNGFTDTLCLYPGENFSLVIDLMFPQPKIRNKNFEFRDTKLIALLHKEKWKKATVRLTIRYFTDRSMTEYFGQRMEEKKFKKWEKSEWSLPDNAPEKKGQTVAYTKVSNQSGSTIYIPMLEWKCKADLAIDPGNTAVVRISPNKKITISGLVDMGTGWLGQSPKRSRTAPHRRLSANGLPRQGTVWQSAQICVEPSASLVITEAELKQSLAGRLVIWHFGQDRVVITGDLEAVIGPNSQQAFTVYKGEYLQVNAAFYREASSMPYANRQYTVRFAKEPYFHWDQWVNAHLDIRD